MRFSNLAIVFAFKIRFYSAELAVGLSWNLIQIFKVNIESRANPLCNEFTQMGFFTLTRKSRCGNNSDRDLAQSFLHHLTFNNVVGIFKQIVKTTNAFAFWGNDEILIAPLHFENHL